MRPLAPGEANLCGSAAITSRKLCYARALLPAVALVSFPHSRQTRAMSEPPAASRFSWLNWSSLFLAFLQSVCSAFLALHGIRLLVGLGAVVLASSAWHLAERLHVSAIRVPALWQVRRLRARSASAWRQRPRSPAEQRSESLQLVLSFVTLFLLVAESVAHYTLFHTP